MNEGRGGEVAGKGTRDDGGGGDNDDDFITICWIAEAAAECVRACVFVHCAITIIIIYPQHRQRNKEVARVSAVATAAAAAA